MADSKITGLAELDAIADNDLFVVVDDPSGSPITKKMTLATLKKTFPGAATFFVPLSATDGSFNLTGELRAVATGQTANYGTDFGLGNQHLYIKVNAVTVGGNIVITGTSLSESTAVPVAGDTETITIDTSTNQYYQSSKKWLEITNVNVTGGTITGLNYDLGAVGYVDFGNRDFTIAGFRLEYRVGGPIADARFRIYKVQDNGSKKFSLVSMEDIGFTSTNGGGTVVDHVRGGGSSRSYTAGSTLSPIHTMLCFKQGDFESFFSSDENHIEGAAKDEGIIIQFLGEPSGDVSNIDSATVIIYFLLGA